MRLALLLLVACTDKTVVLGDTAAGGDDTAATDSGADTGGDSGVDTSGDSGEPADPSAFAGDWSGTVMLTPAGPQPAMEPPPPPALCEGDVVVTVRGDGGFGGQADCSAPQAPGELTLAFTGEVGADGAAVGEVTMSGPQGTGDAFTFRGTFTPRDFTLAWEGALTAPDGQLQEFTGAAFGFPYDG